MKKLLLGVIAGFAVLVLGTLVFLATWDIPPPTARVEKAVPNDRIGK